MPVREIGWDRFGVLLLNGVLFKSLVAAADTPMVYVCVGWMRRRLLPKGKLTFKKSLPQAIVMNWGHAD